MAVSIMLYSFLIDFSFVCSRKGYDVMSECGYAFFNNTAAADNASRAACLEHRVGLPMKTKSLSVNGWGIFFTILYVCVML